MDEITDDSMDLVVDTALFSDEFDQVEKDTGSERDEQSCKLVSAGGDGLNKPLSLSPLKQVVAPEKRIAPPDISDEATNSPKPERKKRRGYVDSQDDPIPIMNYELQQGFRILREILSDANKTLNFPFVEEVDVEGLGLWDYHDKIEHPMWLKKMKEKFLTGMYESITQFVADFRLMLENCYRYNGPDHYVSKKGQKLEQVMEQKLSLLSRELREKTTLTATSGKDGISVGMSEFDSMDFKGIRRRGKVIQPNDSTALLNQLRREELLKEKQFRRQQIMEKKQEKEQYYHDLIKWDETLMGGPDGAAQMRAMWELPHIGLFLYLCQEPMRLWEVPQFELERAFYIPRESSTMQRVMTALLRTQSQRIRDEKKPLFTYRQWNYKLKMRIMKWYKILEDKKSEEMAARSLGIDPRFFTVLGNKRNPLEKKFFHELTPYQRVWIVKAICDNNLEIQETLREAIECNPPMDQKEYVLGTDGDGNSYIHFPQFCGQDLRIYRQAPFKYPKFDKPKPVEKVIKQHGIKKSASPSPKKTPAKKKRISELPSTPTNRPSRLRQVIKPVLKPSTCTPETSDTEDDAQSLSSYSSSVDSRAARALRREQIKGIQMVHSKRNLDRMFEKEKAMMDLLDGEDTSMDCDSPAPSFHARPDLKASLQKVCGKLTSDDSQSEDEQIQSRSGDVENGGDADERLSLTPQAFGQNSSDNNDEKVDSESLVEKSNGSDWPDNEDSNLSDACKIHVNTAVKREVVDEKVTDTNGADCCQNSMDGEEVCQMNGICDSNVMLNSLDMGVHKAEILWENADQNTGKVQEHLSSHVNGRESDELRVKCEVPFETIGVKKELDLQQDNTECSQGTYLSGDIKVELEVPSEDSSVQQDFLGCSHWDNSLNPSAIKSEHESGTEVPSGRLVMKQDISQCSQEENRFGDVLVKTELEDLGLKCEVNTSGDNVQVKKEQTVSDVAGSCSSLGLVGKDVTVEFTGADSGRGGGTGHAGMDDDDDDDDVKIIGEIAKDKDVVVIEEEEDVEPVVPDVKDFELIGDSVEILRSLVKQFDEQEIVPGSFRKGKETAIKPLPRRKCVSELHERLVYLLKELEPWDTKLIQANRKMRERIKKEVEDYVEPPEPEEITIDDSSSSGSDDSSNDDSDSDTDSSDSSSDNKTAGKTKGKRKLEDNSDSESVDVSLRGRQRKRRKIPDNAAEEYENSITRKKPAKKVPPSAANESKTNQTAIQSAIRNMRLPPNHVLIKTSQGYSIIDSVLLQNPQFCAALNPTIIRTVASTTAPSSSVALTTGKAGVAQIVSAPVTRTMTVTTGVAVAPANARSVLVQQLNKPLPAGTTANASGSKKTPLVQTLAASAIPQKPAQAASYARYSGLPDMPQHVIQDLIKKQRQSEVTKTTQPNYSSAKILSSMLNAPDMPRESNVTCEVSSMAPLPASSASGTVVTSVLALSSVTQPINAENWNALLKANPGLLKLVQSPQKSSKYASNITVKSLLETRASQQKVHKSDSDQTKPLTVVVTEPQTVVMADASSSQVTKAETSQIDQIVKSVLSPIKTTLPTVQIKIPSPISLPTITQHNVTSTTRAMKVPIPTAVSPNTGAKNMSSAVKAEKQSSQTAAAAATATANTSNKIVLGAKQTSQIASIIGSEQKNIVLKVVPQTIMTAQGLVQGYVTPQGLFIPKQMLNTPTVLAIKSDGKQTNEGSSSTNSNILNTTNQTVKAIVSPVGMPAQSVQGGLIHVPTSPGVAVPQKIVIKSSEAGGSQTGNVVRGINPGGLLQIPTTVPLSAVNVSNRGVVVQKRARSRGGIVTTALRKPVMSPTVVRNIDFSVADTSAGSTSSSTTMAQSTSSTTEAGAELVISTSCPTTSPATQALAVSSPPVGYGDINTILGQTKDADTVAALQSLVQLSGLMPPDAGVSAPTKIHQSGLVSPVSGVSVLSQSSANTQGSVSVTSVSGKQNLASQKDGTSNIVVREKPKKRSRGNIGLQQHAAVHGLQVHKPEGENVFTVTIAKSTGTTSSEQLMQQTIISNQAIPATSSQKVTVTGQVNNSSSQKLVEVKGASNPKVAVTGQANNSSSQKLVEVKGASNPKLLMSAPQLLSLQNQQPSKAMVETSLPEENVVKNVSSVLSGQKCATVTSSVGSLGAASGISVKQEKVNLSNEVAAGSRMATVNVPVSTLPANVTNTVTGTKSQQTVVSAQVVGQPTVQTPAQQKLILFNIGGQLVTPQGIPVTISQGIVKMLPKSTTAATASTANALKQAQLQLALHQLQPQPEETRMKVTPQGHKQTQEQSSVTRSPATTQTQRPGQSQSGQLVNKQGKQQTTTQQLLLSQVDQAKLFNQLRQSQSQVQSVSSGQGPTQPQVIQRPATLQLPQQQKVTLQPNYVQQLQTQVGQSNVVMQVLPQNVSTSQKTESQPQSMQQTGSGHIVQPTSTGQQVQLALGVQASVQGVQMGQQVVRIGQQAVRLVQPTAGVQSPGQATHNVLRGVHLAQQSIGGVQQSVGGVQFVQQSTQHPAGGVQLLQQSSQPLIGGVQGKQQSVSGVKSVQQSFGGMQQTVGGVQPVRQIVGGVKLTQQSVGVPSLQQTAGGIQLVQVKNPQKQPQNPTFVLQQTSVAPVHGSDSHPVHVPQSGQTVIKFPQQQQLMQQSVQSPQQQQNEGSGK